MDLLFCFTDKETEAHRGENQELATEPTAYCSVEGCLEQGEEPPAEPLGLTQQECVSAPSWMALCPEQEGCGS